MKRVPKLFAQTRKRSTYVNTAGTTINVRIVDDTIPPIIATPIAVRVFEASFRPIATGNVPAIKANEVIKIGRRRVLPAKIKASERDLPSDMACFAKSTSKIPFFPATPINIKKPKIAKIVMI
ncbi:hypothetical protein D3C87_1757500 [compost metagenome]